MMRPMPFCPSFEPCANETPVQVRIRSPRIHHGGGWLPVGLLVERRIADDEFQDEQQQGRREKADQRRKQQRVADFCRLAPVDARGAVAAVQQRVGDADANDRADQGVRR